MPDKYLAGDLSIDQVMSWSEGEWREFQFHCMISVNARISKLESRASWQQVLMTIPWTLVGALLVALAK